MTKKFKGLILSSLSSVSLISLLIPSFAQSIPDIYRFIPKETVLSVNIKPNDKAWSVFGKNNPFKNNDTLFGKDAFDIFDPAIKDNIENNLVIGVSEFNIKDPKNDPFFMAVEMKNTKLNSFIKDKISKKLLSKKDTQLITSNFEDAEILSFIPKDPKNKNYKPSYFVFLKNYIVTTKSVSMVQDTIKSYYNPDEESIYSSEYFLKSYNKLGSDFQVQSYVNMKKLMSSFSKISNSSGISSPFKSINNPGFGMNETIMLNLSLMNKSLEVTTFTIPDKKNPLMKSYLKYKPSTFQDFLNFLPKDSVAFLGFAESNFEDYFKSLTPKQNSDVNIKAFKNVFGIDISEVYSNMKNDTVFAAFNTPDNPVIPGFAVFLTPKDKVKMSKTISSLKIDLGAFSGVNQRGNRKLKSQEKKEKSSVLKFSEMKEYKEKKIAVTNEVPELIRFGIKPAFTFIGEKLIFASNEEVMKSIIDRVLTEAPEFTLDKNEKFTVLRDILGNSNNSLGYINLSSFINMAGTFTSDVPNSAEVFSNLKKFHAIGFNSKNDADGIFGHIVVLADLDQIDFEKLFPKKSNSKNKIDVNKSKSTYY